MESTVKEETKNESDSEISKLSEISRLSEIQLSEDKKNTNILLVRSINELLIDNKSIDNLISESKIVIKPEELKKIIDVINYLNIYMI